MPISLTTLGETVRRVYDPKIAQGVYDKSPLFNMIEKEVVDTSLNPGADARVNIFKSYGAGETSFTEGGNFNDAGDLSYATATYTIKNLAYKVKMTGTALASTQEGQPAKSGFKAINEAVKRGVEALGLANERQLHGWGNAYIAQCDTTTASATVVLNTGGGDYDGKQAIARGWLAPGRKIDIGTSANETSVVADATIVSVDASAGTIVIDSAVTTSSSHFISVQNARSGATSYEMSGLAQIVDSNDSFGTIGGLAYTDGPHWVSPENSTATSLTLPVIRDLERSIRQSVGVSPDVIVCGYKQAAKIQALAEAQLEWTQTSAMKFGDPFEGRYQVLEGKKIVPSHMCQDHRVYLLSTQDFVLLEQNKPSWRPPTVNEAQMFYVNPDADLVSGVIRHYRQLGVKRRCTSGVFNNLTA